MRGTPTIKVKQRSSRAVARRPRNPARGTEAAASPTLAGRVSDYVGTLLGRAFSLLFVLAVPVFLLSLSLTWAFNDLRLYRYGFEKYDVSVTTGMELSELMRAARQVRGYFNSFEEPLVVRAVAFGEEREIFSQREVLHMRDVKRMVWGVYGALAVSGLYLVGFTARGLGRNGRAFGGRVARLAALGSVVTAGAVALAGLATLLMFDTLFLLFHRLSFANDFWQLDPYRDYLVMMFPQGFWFDATLFVGLASLVMGLVISALSWAYLAWERRRWG